MESGAHQGTDTFPFLTLFHFFHFFPLFPLTLGESPKVVVGMLRFAMPEA